MANLKDNPRLPCPRDDIAAYIDGELSPSEELDLEMHFVECDECKSVLDSQKGLLTDLELAFEDRLDAIDLPDDFARVVTKNAESRVEGIRSPVERSRALFACAALFLVITVSVGADAGNLVAAIARFTGQVFAVGGVVLHAVYEFGVGLGVVMSCLGGRLVFGSLVSGGLIATVFVFGSFLLSRLLFRFNRFS